MESRKEHNLVKKKCLFCHEYFYCIFKLCNEDLKDGCICPKCTFECTFPDGRICIFRTLEEAVVEDL